MTEEEKRGIELIGKAAKLIGHPYNEGLKVLLGPKLMNWLDVPNMTGQGMIAMMGDNEVRERAEACLLRHNLFDTSKLPTGERASVDNCPLANVLGGSVEARTLLSMDFLDPMERMLLVEFFQRFDIGRYPDLVQQSTWASLK